LRGVLLIISAEFLVKFLVLLAHLTRTFEKGLGRHGKELRRMWFQAGGNGADCSLLLRSCFHILCPKDIGAGRSGCRARAAGIGAAPGCSGIGGRWLPVHLGNSVLHDP
jgi:hypothetical protein